MTGAFRCGLGLGRGEVVQRACVAVGALAQGGGLRWQVRVVGFGVLVARQDGQGRGKQACQAVGIGQSTVLRKLLVHFRFLNVSQWRGKPGSEPGMLRIRYAYILPRVYHHTFADCPGQLFCAAGTIAQSTSCPSRGSNGDKPYV